MMVVVGQTQAVALIVAIGSSIFACTRHTDSVALAT